jgi:hypothetical protein
MRDDGEIDNGDRDDELASGVIYWLLGSAAK